MTSGSMLKEKKCHGLSHPIHSVNVHCLPPVNKIGLGIE